MSSGKSRVWRAFDRVERAIGEPLENAVASPRYIDVVVKGMRVQRAIGGAVGRVAGGVVTRVLHVAQIPTRDDLRHLNRQLTTLTTEMRTLSEKQQNPPRKRTPTKAPTRRTATRREPDGD